VDNYIIEKFGEVLGYDNSAQLCLRLFCTVSLVPEQYHMQCTKEGLTELFSLLSKKGFVVTPKSNEAEPYNASKYEITDKRHWLAVINSMFNNENVIKESSRVYFDSKLAA